MGLRFSQRALVAAVLMGGAASAALAADGVSSTATPAELAAAMATARASIDQTDYWGAIGALNNVVTADPRNPDAYNLLGFAYRKLKNFELAERNYGRALRLDPNHKGALEYLGLLYIETDRIIEAKEMLAHLEQLCPRGCEELADLRQAFNDR